MPLSLVVYDHPSTWYYYLDVEGYFKPLIPYARQHNIRLVLLNQRDYRNSSPFTPAELETLHTQDKETQKGFIEKRVVELANFLEWFVRKEGIPKVSPSSDDGGLAIITWSSGNHLSIPLLGFAEVVPPSTRDFLNEYLRSIIIYGMFVPSDRSPAEIYLDWVQMPHMFPSAQVL